MSESPRPSGPATRKSELGTTTSSRSREKLLSDPQKTAMQQDADSNSLTSDSTDIISSSISSQNTDAWTEPEDIKIPARMVIPCNSPEKIVFAVDTAVDENCSDFQLPNGDSCSPLAMVKKAIEIFIHNKNAIDSRHQYALVILTENLATWLLDFTSDVGRFLKALQNLEECDAEDIFSLNSLFGVINENIVLEPIREEVTVPPAFTLRTILLYGRSFTLPQIEMTDVVEKLLTSPYFTLDVLMTHEPPSSDNNCAKISKVLQNVDTKGFAYFFSVARSTADLHVAMAKLLSHPLQRPMQRIAKYSISYLRNGQ